MRVIPNGAGSDLQFTLFQQDGMTDDAFEQEAGTVQGDLARLKELLESTAA